MHISTPQESNGIALILDSDEDMALLLADVAIERGMPPVILSITDLYGLAAVEDSALRDQKLRNIINQIAEGEKIRSVLYGFSLLKDQGIKELRMLKTDSKLTENALFVGISADSKGEILKFAKNNPELVAGSAILTKPFEVTSLEEILAGRPLPLGLSKNQYGIRVPSLSEQIMSESLFVFNPEGALLSPHARAVEGAKAAVPLEIAYAGTSTRGRERF